MRCEGLHTTKPVILLVDDDFAVLQAIESEISSRFSEVFRIESYGAAETALGGVRLCVAEHARSILLTGYGGLDVAIEAKNRSVVDHDDTFGPCSSLRELPEILELRYRAYRVSPYAPIVVGDVSSDEEQPPDPHDARSIILVTRRNRNSLSTVIGTLRLLTCNESPHEEESKKLLGLNTDLPEVDQSTVRFWPMARFFDDVSPLDFFIREFKAEGLGVAEAGRHAIEPRDR